MAQLKSTPDCRSAADTTHQEQFIAGQTKKTQSDNQLKQVPARNFLTLDEEIAQPSQRILPAGSEFERSLFLQTAFHQYPRIADALSVCWLRQIPTCHKINSCW